MSMIVCPHCGKSFDPDELKKPKPAPAKKPEVPGISCATLLKQLTAMSHKMDEMEGDLRFKSNHLDLATKALHRHQQELSALKEKADSAPETIAEAEQKFSKEAQDIVQVEFSVEELKNRVASIRADFQVALEQLRHQREAEKAGGSRREDGRQGWIDEFRRLQKAEEKTPSEGRAERIAYWKEQADSLERARKRDDEIVDRFLAAQK